MHDWAKIIGGQDTASLLQGPELYELDKIYLIIHSTGGSQEPVIPHLVFNLTSKFHRKTSTDSFSVCHLKFLLIVMAAILDQRSFQFKLVYGPLSYGNLAKL
jgi:hypothetical protein